MLGKDQDGHGPAAGGPAPAAASRPFAAAHLLTLPVLDAGVPRRVEIVENDGGNLLPLALAMAGEGLITHTDLDRDKRGHLLPICTAAFERWVRTESAGLSFSISATFTDNWPAHFEDLVGDFSVRDGEDGLVRLQRRPAALVLVMNTDSSAWALVGPKCTALEKAHPGLGASVLRILENGLDSTIGGFGPGRSLGVAQMLHWRGESDHHEMMNEIEWENDGLDLTDLDIGADHGPVTFILEWTYDDKEFLREEWTWDIAPDVAVLQLRCFDFGQYDIITKPRFHEYLPEWCCNFGLKTMPPAKLRRLGAKLLPELAAPVLIAADLAAALEKTPPGGDHPAFYAIGESLYPMLLGWAVDTDMVARMYDDMARGTMESGEGTAVRWLTIFNPNSEKQCADAIRQLRACFAIIRRCKVLLDALADHINY